MVSSKLRRPDLHAAQLDDLVSAALREDLGAEPGDTDVTTRFIVDADLMGEARVIAKQAGVLSGSDAAARVFQMVKPPTEYSALKPDGARIALGEEAARVVGPLGSILTAERTALNFLQRLSGIATVTRRYADALAPYPVWDAILIKDNHAAASGGVTEAITRARQARMPIEVEVDTLEQLGEALAAGAETILLDNMTVDLMRRAVEMTAGRAELEASGGMTLERAVAAAKAGVDRISVGALTHSAPALDLSLEVVKTWR